MSTEPTSIEASVTPPTLIDSENSGVEASSQTKGTTGEKKSHSSKKNPSNVVDTSQDQLVLPRKEVEGGQGIFKLGDLIKKHVGKD
ncbi:hypothetical protein GOBAR_DD24094 [Gossypium barbadense]|nr:hypothetical protein GOBAR_DD24094 [Gossypium barbadense]